MDAEGMFFASLLTRGDPAALRGMPETHFSEDWRPIYQFIIGFQREQGKLPRLDTVAENFRRPFPQAPEPPAFYAEKVRENALRVAMESGLTEGVAEPLKEGRAKDALEGAKKVIANLQRDFRRPEEGLVLPDLSTNVRARMADYQRRKQNIGKVGIPTPWPVMTRATGGLQPGDAWSILARPNIGKTWVLVLWATYLWQCGFRVLFASMETPPQAALPKDKHHRLINGCCLTCYQVGVSPREDCPSAFIPRQRLSIRFDAVGGVVPAWRLLTGTLSPLEEKQLERYYWMCERPAQWGWGSMKIVANPFVATVEDLEAEILSYGPDVTFWDSAIFAARPTQYQSRTEAASELCVNIKDAAERTGVPIVNSWHFNRDVDEEAVTASANAAALSDDMNKAMDVMIAMFRTPQLELAGEALFRSLKVREGLAMRELRTHWLLKEALNFAEISDAPPGKDSPNEASEKKA
jgi:hypothetical protein